MNRYKTPSGDIVADDEYIAANFPAGSCELIGPAEMVGPALKWSDDNLPPEYWHVDVGPFFDRFGAAQIPILSSTDATVQAAVKLATVRKYIDLKLPMTGQLVDLIASKGFAVTRAQVLNKPTTDYERHIKGLPQPE